MRIIDAKEIEVFEAKPQTTLNFLMRLRLAFSRSLSTLLVSERITFFKPRRRKIRPFQEVSLSSLESFLCSIELLPAC